MVLALKSRQRPVTYCVPCGRNLRSKNEAARPNLRGKVSVHERAVKVESFCDYFIAAGAADVRPIGRVKECAQAAALGLAEPQTGHGDASAAVQIQALG
jgi:hypothetical protein